MRVVKLIAGIAEIMYIEYLNPYIPMMTMLGVGTAKDSSGNGSVNVFQIILIAMIGIAVHMIATRYDDNDVVDYLLLGESTIVAIAAFYGQRFYENGSAFMILAGICIVNFAISAISLVMRWNRWKSENAR